MNEAQVISVNPGVKTLGELGPSVSKLDRLNRISRSIAPVQKGTASVFKRLINVLLGLNQKVNAQLSGKLMLLRLLCGGLMVASVLVPMTPESIIALEFGVSDIIMCTLGISLVLGFLSRITSYAGAGWFGYCLVVSMMSATPDLTAGALMLLMLVFSVLGPGMFSADQLIRKGIFATRKKIRQRRLDSRRRESLHYRAFAEVERRVV